MQPENSNAKAPTPKSFIPTTQITRRSFIGSASAATVLAGVPRELKAQQAIKPGNFLMTEGPTFLDLLRFPDRVTAYSQITDPLPLTRSQGEWRGGGIEIDSKVGAREVAIDVYAPGIAVRYIHLRWDASVTRSVLILADHWVLAII